MTIKYPILCEDTKETCLTYKKYLQSKHWKNIKIRYANSKLNHNCVVCGVLKETKYMHHHHKSYKRIGNERLNDIIILCEQCHSQAHNVLRIEHSQKINAWNVHKRLKRKKSPYALAPKPGWHA